MEFLFWKYHFKHTTFLYSSTRSSEQFLFLISDFLANSQSQQKLGKKVTYFTIQFRSKSSLILQTSTHLTLKIIRYCNTAKSLSHFTDFSANIFLFGVGKNICTAPFFDAQELHSWSTLNANVCIFMYISTRKLLSQRRSKIRTSRVRLWLNFS